jgi:hypothetical protein
MVRARRAVAALVLAVIAPSVAPGASAAADRLEPGIWLTHDEVARLPMHGPSWDRLLLTADEKLGRADLSDQDSEHDVRVLAAALVYARTGEKRFRRKAAAGIMEAIGTEHDGRTLALARGLVSYVVAADLIDMRANDPDQERVFARWLDEVRNERLKPESRPTLVLTHEWAPNNWGAHAGASRIAADIYLGDSADLARAAAVFKGYVGDRAVYSGFNYGDDLSWQADEQAPVGIDPPGASKDGIALDGVLPDDMRRGCPLRDPPCPTLYPWEAMQGLVVQAELLSRQGYDAWDWGDQALRRAATYLFALHDREGHEDWGAPGGDQWIPWLLNARYGTDFPTTKPARPGKGMGFTDWTVAARPECADGPCTEPRGELRTVAPIAARTEAPGNDRAGGNDDGGGGRDGRNRADDGGSGVVVVVAAIGAVVVLLGAGLALHRRARRRSTTT